MTADSQERISIFGIDVDRVTLSSAATLLTEWVESGERLCRYVVTPNLDHVLLYQGNAAFRQAYSKASLVVADGWPLVTASRIFHQPLPERVPGSDLVPELFDECERRGVARTVFLLGAAEGVADQAALAIHRRWSTVKVVGTCSPPPGFEKHLTETNRITRLVNQCDPDILVVGFGAPKQELWLHHAHAQLKAGVAIAAGATIDFLGGRQKRAPVWMQRLRLEWSHRLLLNPRRLSGRYARNAWQLPPLLIKELFGRNVARPVAGNYFL